MDPEMYQPGGRQLHLILAASTKGPKLTPGIVCFGVREFKEGDNEGRTNPRQKPAADKPPGKAVKCPSPPANPGIPAEGEVDVGSPSKASRKKVTQPKPPRQPKTVNAPSAEGYAPGSRSSINITKKYTWAPASSASTAPEIQNTIKQEEA